MLSDFVAPHPVTAFARNSVQAPPTEWLLEGIVTGAQADDDPKMHKLP